MTETQITKLVRSVSKDDRRLLQNTLASILHEIAMLADETPKPTQAERQSADKILKEGGNESSLINDPDFISRECLVHYAYVAGNNNGCARSSPKVPRKHCR
jgi:hypothetical protein